MGEAGAVSVMNVTLHATDYDCRMNRAIGSARLLAMVLVIAALIATLTDTSGLVPGTLAQIATYFTFQANVIALVVWGAVTFYIARQTPMPRWLEYGRTFVAANLVTVGAIYWIAIAPLGLEDGGQLIFVMIASHIVTPVFAIADQTLVGTRSPIPWRHWWVFVAWATIWVNIAIRRSLLDGPVIYDYLDPALGMASIAGSLAWNFALLVACALGAMRIRRWRRYECADAVTSDAITASGVGNTSFEKADQSSGSTSMIPSS